MWNLWGNLTISHIPCLKLAQTTTLNFAGQSKGFGTGDRNLVWVSGKRYLRRQFGWHQAKSARQVQVTLKWTVCHLKKGSNNYVFNLPDTVTAVVKCCFFTFTKAMKRNGGSTRKRTAECFAHKKKPSCHLFNWKSTLRSHLSVFGINSLPENKLHPQFYCKGSVWPFVIMFELFREKVARKFDKFSVAVRRESKQQFLKSFNLIIALLYLFSGIDSSSNCFLLIPSYLYER